VREVREVGEVGEAGEAARVDEGARRRRNGHVSVACIDKGLV